MKSFLLVLVICCIHVVLHANDTLFFKHNVIQVDSKPEAEFYWVLEQISENEDEILLSKYYANDKLMARTYYTNYSRRIKSGDELLYYPNSQMAAKKQYLDGKLHGYSRLYTYEGQLERESYYLFGNKVSTNELIKKDSIPLSKEESARMLLYEDLPIHDECIEIENEQDRNECTARWVQQFIGLNTRYPAQPRDAGIQGKIYLRYLINENGRLDEVEVVKTVEGGAALETEAIRVILGLPKFIPGAQFGERTKIEYTVPISFRLSR